MAIVLDVNILCNKILDIKLIATYLEKYSINIDAVYSIDNWMWENKKEIKDFKQISNLVDSQHIVVIELNKPSTKAVGLYIEKVENHFLYTLWINTEGYSVLDCEEVTMDNRESYRNIMQGILGLISLEKDSFVLAGIGLETDFCYENDIEDIILKSKNMLIWMINKYNGRMLQLSGFRGEMIEDIYVLQKEN